MKLQAPTCFVHLFVPQESGMSEFTAAYNVQTGFVLKLPDWSVHCLLISTCFPMASTTHTWVNKGEKREMWFKCLACTLTPAYIFANQLACTHTPANTSPQTSSPAHTLTHSHTHPHIAPRILPHTRTHPHTIARMHPHTRTRIHISARINPHTSPQSRWHRMHPHTRRHPHIAGRIHPDTRTLSLFGSGIRSYGKRLAYIHVYVCAITFIIQPPFL